MTPIRINAFLARALGRSRRACDALIASGRVTVAGRAAQPNDRIDASVPVLLDGRPVRAPEQIYLAFNKPSGYLTARSDARAKTVQELLPEKYRRLFPVGRLDKDTRGLLFFTNDGAWADRLMHPSHEVARTYLVELDRPPRLEALRARVLLDDGPSLFDRVSLPSGPRRNAVEVTLHEGRKRQIRRHMKALGYRILDLVRTEIGGILLGDLPERGVRLLTEREVRGITQARTR